MTLLDHQLYFASSEVMHVDGSSARAKREQSLEAGSTGNGLRRFILRDRFARDNGWVLLDETQIELVVI
jgi:hypothetical protein